MASQLFRINLKDLAKGAAVAILGAVFAYLSEVLKAESFSFTTIDWAQILLIVRVTFFAYISKNFLTDEDGTLHLGVVKIKS